MKSFLVQPAVLPAGSLGLQFRFDGVDIAMNVSIAGVAQDSLRVGRFDLLPSLPQQDDWNCSQADLEVEQQRPSINVLKVELHPLVEIDVVPPLGLP